MTTYRKFRSWHHYSRTFNYQVHDLSSKGKL